MKKIDLHVHTIANKLSDSHFDFDITVLKDYITQMNLDAIAITNHNLFCREQYETIKKEIMDCKIFPGVEVDIENAHLLVVATDSEEEIRIFSRQCDILYGSYNGNTDKLFAIIY